MASSSIASASLKLTTDAGGLSQGLSSAEGKLKDWGRKQEKQSQDIGKGINDAMQSGKGKDDKGGGIGGIGSALAAIPGIAGIVVGATVAIGGAFAGVASEINKTSRSAKELGVGVLGFSALEAAAKVARVSTEDLQGGILSLETALQQADEPAERLFGQLGLSVQQLRQLPVDEAMAQIADALAKVDDPAARARLSLQVFGDRALALQPLLDKGGQGIRKLTDEAKASGAAFDEVSADKVSAASEAMSKLSGIWSGFCNWLAISVAGIVDWGASALSSIGGVASSVSSWFSSMGETISSWASSAYASITEAVGDVWDDVQPYWDSFAEYASEWWDTLSETASSAWGTICDYTASALDSMGIDSKATFASINDGLSWLKDRFSDLWSYVASFWDWIWGKKKGQDALKDAASTIADMAGGEGSSSSGGSWEEAGAKDSKRYGEGFRKGLTKASMEALKGMNDLESELRKTLATIGMTSSESRIWELGQKGASKEQLEKLKELAKEVKNVEAAWGTIEVQPLEMFQRQLDGLDAMLASGRISWEQYSLGVVKANKQMMAAAGVGELKTVGGALKDSSAAVSASIKAELSDRVQNDPAAEMRRAQAELKAIQERQLKTAELMLAELKKKNDDDEWGEF